ncbi:MAG: triosephosphate isomerase [Clostridia bacterium]|nr:triosephosphate isomerase [Clostridia bacterium]
MSLIFLNLKRFDIPREKNGVNSISSPFSWGEFIIKNVQDKLSQFDDSTFVVFFPEAHIIPAVLAKNDLSPMIIGCQGVHYADTQKGGNFGAFTTGFPASAASSIGCQWTIIGHCEERRDKINLIAQGGGNDYSAVNAILNQEIKCALNAGLSVLYCIGEKQEELEISDKVLKDQLQMGLEGVNTEKIVIAYEPVWAIGPGKTLPDRSYIMEKAQYIKEITNGLPVVYGGGLKKENAAMLASIDEISGGLIALTRFSGDIGFYPDEYIEIIKAYHEK